MKQNPAEAGVSGQILIDVGDLLANPRIPGRQANIGLMGKQRLPGLRIPALNARQIGREIEGQHRHPGINLHPAAGLQLPGDEVKQVGAHRQPAVGEIERLDRAVALRVGEGLQKDVADFHVIDALYQLIDILCLLDGIGVIDIVQIHMHHPNRIGFLNLGYGVGKGLDRRVTGDQHARNIVQILHVAQAVVQRKRQLIPLLFGDGQGAAAGGAVGPHPGARRFPGNLMDFRRYFLHVIGHSPGKLRVAFIAAGGFIPAAVGGGRLAAALRIGRQTVVRGPGVSADLHQRRAAELAHHLPGSEALARRHQAAKINGLTSGSVHPAAHRRPQRRDVPGFKQRPYAGVKAAVTIVKTEEKSLGRQRL